MRVKDTKQLITFLKKHSKAINRLFVMAATAVILGSNVEILIECSKGFAKITIS